MSINKAELCLPEGPSLFGCHLAQVESLEVRQLSAPELDKAVLPPRD